MGISGITLPPDPVQGAVVLSSGAEAFDAEPEVRVMFDNGAGKGPLGNGPPGDPYPAFQAGFKSFPVPGTAARSWYLGPRGAGRRGAGRGGPTASPGTRARGRRPICASRRQAESGPGGVWTASPDYRWSTTGPAPRPPT